MPEFSCRNQFTLECNFSFDSSYFCTSHFWLWMMHRSRDPALGVVMNSWMKVFHLCSVLQLTYRMLGIITKMHLLRHTRLAKDCLSKAAFLKGFAFFILEIELLLNLLFVFSFCCLQIFAAAAEYGFSTPREYAGQGQGHRYKAGCYEREPYTVPFRKH